MTAPVINIMTYVLDDHKPVLMLIEKAFKNAGISNYRLFNNEVEFLNSINESVHIAVIDYMLESTEITGLDVCKKLLEINPRCYVIIMTGQGSIEVVIDMMNSGAKKYVPKWDKNYIQKVADFVQEGVEVIKRDLEYYTLLVNKLSTLKENDDLSAAK